VGCQKTLTPQEFTDYLNNPANGFITENKTGHYNFSLQYLPPELISLQYVFSGIEKDFEKLKKESDSTLHFKLTICNTDSVPEDHKSPGYQDKMNYLNTGIMENCLLISQNGDSIQPVIHLYEKGFNIKPCENVLFGFENKKGLKLEKILIKAPLYFNGYRVFDIRKVKSLNVPKINL
jgi:hypothetical protein